MYIYFVSVKIIVTWNVIVGFTCCYTACRQEVDWWRWWIPAINGYMHFNDGTILQSIIPHCISSPHHSYQYSSGKPTCNKRMRLTECENLWMRKKKIINCSLKPLIARLLFNLFFFVSSHIQCEKVVYYSLCSLAGGVLVAGVQHIPGLHELFGYL